MKLKKLKVHPDFTPLPVSEGDELFPNGIFEFNVTKLVVFIRDHPKWVRKSSLTLFVQPEIGRQGTRLAQGFAWG